MADAFAIWITGLPASGKSTLVRSVKTLLAERGVIAAVLESDTLRPIFTDHPSYGEAERDRFYHQLVSLGQLLTSQGIPVIFDATANRRAYRDQARARIPNFLEIYLDCPLETCIARDPKGIYRNAAANVPGLHSPFEPPLNPDVVIHFDREPVESSARRVLDKLRDLGVSA